MVAITVILAAVIAAFVFGMAGNVQKTRSVAITAEKIANSVISVTNMGGKDVDNLDSVWVNITWSNGTALQANAANELGSTTGSTKQFAGTSGKDHIIGIGYFNDGQSQVLLDTYT
jgi:FlaG/FlaF family flagellin (archaellin)